MRGRRCCYENRAHEGRPRVDEVDGAELCREVGCPEEMSTLSSVNQGRPKAGDTIQQKVDQRSDSPGKKPARLTSSSAVILSQKLFQTTRENFKSGPTILSQKLFQTTQENFKTGSAGRRKQRRAEPKLYPSSSSS